MKQRKYKGKELLPLSVIDDARNGDAQAVESVLRYYEGYINKLCTRTLYDPDSQPRIRVDEYMKRRLEIKLIHSIYRQHELTKPAPAAETAYPFPCFRFPGIESAL